MNKKNKEQGTGGVIPDKNTVLYLMWSIGPDQYIGLRVLSADIGLFQICVSGCMLLKMFLKPPQKKPHKKKPLRLLI